MINIHWNYEEPAPHDRWILVDLDDGSQDCLEKPGKAIHLAIWEPRSFVHKGLGTYEWRVLRGGEFDHWSSGRVMGWAELPTASAYRPAAERPD